MPGKSRRHVINVSDDASEGVFVALLTGKTDPDPGVALRGGACVRTDHARLVSTIGDRPDRTSDSRGRSRLRRHRACLPLLHNRMAAGPTGPCGAGPSSRPQRRLRHSFERQARDRRRNLASRRRPACLCFSDLRGRRPKDRHSSG